MVKATKNIFGRTALGVGSTWIVMFIIGLLMVFIPLKKVNENEMSKEEANKVIIPGAIIFALCLLFGTGVFITVLGLLIAWYIPR